MVQILFEGENVGIIYLFIFAFFTTDTTYDINKIAKLVNFCATLILKIFILTRANCCPIHDLMPAEKGK